MEDLSIQQLSLLTLEERNAYRLRQYRARVQARPQAEQADYAASIACARAERQAKQAAQHRRQDANHAARADENRARQRSHTTK